MVHMAETHQIQRGGYLIDGLKLCRRVTRNRQQSSTQVSYRLRLTKRTFQTRESNTIKASALGRFISQPGNVHRLESARHCQYKYVFSIDKQVGGQDVPSHSRTLLKAIRYQGAAVDQGGPVLAIEGFLC